MWPRDGRYYKFTYSVRYELYDWTIAVLSSAIHYDEIVHNSVHLMVLGSYVHMQLLIIIKSINIIHYLLLWLCNHKTPYTLVHSSNHILMELYAAILILYFSFLIRITPYIIWCIYHGISVSKVFGMNSYLTHIE